MKDKTSVRVLHIGKFYPPFAGGIENFMGDLLPALENMGVHTAALVHAHESRSGKPSSPTLDGKGTSLPIWRVPSLGRLLYTPISPRFPFWLQTACKKWQPDLLHIHMPNPSAFWAMCLPLARRIPWIVHWHADVVASHIDRRLSPAYTIYRPFEQKLLALSRKIIATSPPYLASSQPLTPWRSKCATVPLGLDPARLPEPDPEALQIANDLWPEQRLKILAVGRLTYYKGHEVLLRALAGLPDIGLCLVGEGEQRAGLKALIGSLHLEKRVILLGHQPESIRNALLASCDLVCLPSVERTEAFGLVLLEAMRYGKAVVAADIPGSGVGWVVERNKSGLLVEPNNNGMLAEALESLAADPERREAMGRAGAARFREQFHIQQVARQIKTIYVENVAPAPVLGGQTI